MEKEPRNESGKSLKDYYYIGLTAFFVIIASAGVVFLLFHISQIKDMLFALIGMVAPIIYGFIIAYILNPIMRVFERYFLRLYQYINYKQKKHMKNLEKVKKAIRLVSILLAMIIAGVIVYVLAQLLIPELVKSITGVVDSLPGQIQDFEEKYADLYKKNVGENAIVLEMMKYVEEWVSKDLTPYINSLAKSLLDYTMSFVNVLYNFIIGCIVALYVLQTKEQFAGHCKKVLYSMLKIKQANRFIEYVREVDFLFGKFFIGKIIDSAIIGVLCFIVMCIFSWPYTTLVSVIVGVTNIIPVFGPFIGGFPCTILIMLVDPLQGLFFGIFVIILQTIDGNIIGPKILGESTGLPTFWVVFAILVFGGLLGVKGMIIGVPLFAFIYRLTKKYVEDRLRTKHLMTDTSEYAKYKDIQINPETGEAEYTYLRKK